MQPLDYSDCWNVQHSNHTEPEHKLFNLETWKFICKNLTDSFVVCHDNMIVGYWLGMLNVNPHEETKDIWCLAIDVCTHADYREQGIMDLIMPIATDYHQRIYAFTKKENKPAEGIMSKWGFQRTILENQENDYWTYERENNVS